MTESDRLIDEVLRLDESATKGPWRIVGPYSEGCFLDSGYLIADENAHTPCYEEGDDGSEPIHGPRCGFIEHDANLIASYRSSAPRLARMLRVANDALGRLSHTSNVATMALAEIEKIAKGEA